MSEEHLFGGVLYGSCPKNYTIFTRKLLQRNSFFSNVAGLTVGFFFTEQIRTSFSAMWKPDKADMHSVKIRDRFSYLFNFCSNLYCVKSVQIRSYFWSVFSPNVGKYGPDITPYWDTFRAVLRKLIHLNSFKFQLQFTGIPYANPY